MQMVWLRHFTCPNYFLTNTFPKLRNSSSVDDGKKIGFTRTVAKLSSSKEVRGCWFYGQINSILSWKSWAYLGCYDPTYFKKVINDNKEFVCTECETQFLEGVWPYSLWLRVNHQRSYADEMLWDGKSQHLIGKAAGEFSGQVSIKKLSRRDIPPSWLGSSF